MPKKQSGNKKSKQSNFAKLSIFQPNKYKFKKNNNKKKTITKPNNNKIK